MYKMLIIDDEYLVRRGIRETIDWFRYGILIVGEATNGEMGLELALSLKPDIVISDIKMPLMDGLEFVKKIKDAKLDLEIIILSGYKDFTYSKETLENGAFSYLLKPIDNNELINKVLDAVSLLEKKRHSYKLMSQVKSDLPVLEKKIIEQLMLGEYDILDDIKSKIVTYNFEVQENGYVLYGLIDHPETIKESVREYCDKIVEEINKELKINNIKYNQIFFNDGIFAYLIYCDNLALLTQILNNAILQYEKNNVQVVSLGIGGIFNSLADINNSYQEAVATTRQKLFLAINSIDVYDSTKKQYKPIVYETMEYIAKHYSENIPVKKIADSVFVSESYLLHTFKDNVGKTLNECLTDYRILMAKKMLLEPNVRIYEVAEKVGYSDVKYFSQIFKKKTGYTPSEFINK